MWLWRERRKKPTHEKQQPHIWPDLGCSHVRLIHHERPRGLIDVDLFCCFVCVGFLRWLGKTQKDTNNLLLWLRLKGQVLVSTTLSLSHWFLLCGTNKRVVHPPSSVVVVLVFIPIPFNQTKREPHEVLLLKNKWKTWRSTIKKDLVREPELGRERECQKQVMGKVLLFELPFTFRQLVNHWILFFLCCCFSLLLFLSSPSPSLSLSSPLTQTLLLETQQQPNSNDRLLTFLVFQFTSHR